MAGKLRWRAGKTYICGENTRVEFPPSKVDKIPCFDKYILVNGENECSLTPPGPLAEVGDAYVGGGVGPGGRSEPVERGI